MYDSTFPLSAIFLLCEDIPMAANTTTTRISFEAGNRRISNSAFRFVMQTVEKILGNAVYQKHCGGLKNRGVVGLKNIFPRP